MWDNVQMTLGISQCLDNIFSAIMLGAIDRKNEDNKNLIEFKVNAAKMCIPKFVATFQNNIFCNEYAIFYEIIYSLNVRTFTEAQLIAIIDTNRDLILDSPYVSISKFSKTQNGNIASDDDIINAMTNSLLDKFREFSYCRVLEEEFNSACTQYIDWYKNVYSTQVYQNMTAIMTDIGFTDKEPNKRSTFYKGLDASQEYYRKKMQVIKALSEDSRIRDFVVDKTWFENEMNAEAIVDNKSLCTIGIREMDETIGEMRRGNMIGIMGPPKGGKTRFTNYLVQRLLSYGYNVCVWPLEGTSEEWMGMQIACLLASMSHKALKSGKAKEILRISSKEIVHKKYKGSKELSKQVAAAKQYIATSEKYGRLSFIEGTAYCEDFLSVIENHYNEKNAFDVIVIDSLVNVMSKNGKGKVERISEAYMETKNFIANRLKVPALGLMTAQLKQEAVDFLRNHPEETIDITAGGESAETSRTPDEVIGLFSSKEERDSNMMKVYSVASRHNGSFKDFTARCYLECCMFMSEEEDVAHA